MIVNRDGTTRSLSRDESCLRKLEPLGIVNAGEYRNCYLRKTEDLAPEAASAALRHIQTSGGESKFSSAPTELPPGKWWVDLMPVGGAVLGPFDTRKEAEAANDEFQVENDLPEAIHVRSPEERNLYLKQIEAKGGQVFEQARQLMEDYHQLHLRFDHPQVNDGWDGHTRARNKWIYEQVMAGVAHKETIRELNEKPKEWDRISNGTGVRKAALAYAEKYGLPKPAPRK